MEFKTSFVNNRKLLLQFCIVLLGFGALWAFFPERAKLGNQDIPAVEHKVVIIPTAGVPSVFLSRLEQTLEKRHGFPVLVTTQMGKGPEMVIQSSGQYNSGALAAAGRDVAKRIGHAETFVIVLTNEDINTPGSGLRYHFSTHYQGLSVVSLARINPTNFERMPNILKLPEMYQTMSERALKLINKSIGYGVYGFEASSDWKSVMYGPIMGPKDLDRVGSWY